MTPLEPARRGGLRESPGRTGVLRRVGAVGSRALRRVLAIKNGMASLEDVSRSDADVIYNYSESWIYSAPVWRTARRHRIRLVQDCVEWYEPVCFGGNERHPFLLDHDRKRKTLAAHAAGVTVITSRLESLYAERGVPTLLLPSLCDPLEIDGERARNEPVRRGVLEVVVVASGKPADGDELIRPILETARSRGVRFGVTVIGLRDLFDGRRFVGEPAESGEYEIVRRAGLSRREYLGTLARADVFLLPRRPGLYSEAAFPNRVPEFLASGGVLVTTGVGDLPRYVRDQSSGLICSPDDVSGFASALEWISLHRAAAREIGENGRRVAQTAFDYRVHAASLLAFLLGRPLEVSPVTLSCRRNDHTAHGE